MAYRAYQMPEQDEELDDIICAVCGKPITGDDYNERHTGHEEHCPRYGEDPDEEPADIDCYCDVNYHAACCPDCNKTEPEP